MAVKKPTKSNLSVRQAAVLARAGKPVPRDKALGKVTNAAKTVLRAGGSQTKPKNVTVGGKKMQTKPAESGIGVGAAAAKIGMQFIKSGGATTAKQAPARLSKGVLSGSVGRAGSASTPRVTAKTASTSTTASAAKPAVKATAKQSTRADRRGPSLTSAQKKGIGAGAAGTVASALAISKINKRKY